MIEIHTIRTKLFLLLLLTCLASILLTLGMTSYFAERSLVDRAFEKLSVTNRLQKQGIENYINEHLQTLAIVSSHPATIDLMSKLQRAIPMRILRFCSRNGLK